ncbi:MAG: hypothetical protein ACI8QS_001968 [Planctomycetota bacterium]|jgi:hypothetical protein
MLRSERFWILLLALTAFLAGGAGGVVMGRQMAPTVEIGPFADFEALFTARFSLDEQEQRDLRYILGRYHAEVEALEAKQVALREDELAQIGATWRERIRTWVLSPEERDIFDQLVAGLVPEPLAESTP